jgi:hypothetical protein
MGQMHRVLSGKRHRDRRRALDGFVGSLDPKRNPSGWRARWLEVAGVQSDVVDRMTLRLPALHLVWVPCALQMLLGSRVIHRVDFSGDSMARDPAEFIVDLIGWNWAGQQATGSEEEGEGDAEDA